MCYIVDRGGDMNKKVSNSKQRINELMAYFGLSQTELCKKTGLQKSALSNYLNGDREPRQNQISLIADPFGVNPAWIMGYDAPMFMPEDTDRAKDIRSAYLTNTFKLSEDEKQLIEAYRMLNKNVKESTLSFILSLVNKKGQGSNLSKVANDK